MPRLTLRTLLAYIDDTLEPAEARALGKKVAESEEAPQLVERIKRVTRRRGLSTPVFTDENGASDPNTVAAYLDNALDSPTVKQLEETCLESDVHLAEVAACHQILTLLLTEPVRVPPRAHRRMYQLVDPPASVLNRKPSKTLPISGTAPADAAPEADDADAALLLGLKRYSATTTWAARLALFGAAAVLLVLLAGAVLLSLPHQPPKPPETSPGHSYVLLAPPPPVVPPEPEPKGPGAPPPKAVDGPSAGGWIALAVASLTEPPPKMPPEAPPPKMGGVSPEVTVAAPAERRERVGRLEPPPGTPPVLMLYQNRTEPEPVPWRRAPVRNDDEPLYSNDPVMALPGYKANVFLGERNKPAVEVLLWGNVPEQLQYRVLESRVKFHQPPAGFDADITLQAGRIYLKSKKLDAERKPIGAKVRLRVADEVWDVTLLDAKSDVLVELISWFEPGTPYARKDGPRPKQEGRLAVVYGTAAFEAPKRFKKFDKLVEETQLQWDSTSGALSDPRPSDQQDSVRSPLLDAEFQATLGKVVGAMADAVTDPTGTRSVVKGRLEPAPNAPNRDLVARLAVYAQAALTDPGPDADEMLNPLVDVLRSELPWEARQATVTALVNWIARDRGNTAILHRVLVNKRVGDDRDPEVVADWVLRLLRGYITPFVSVTRPEKALLTELVEKRDVVTPSLLEDKEIAVREAALWNLEAVRQARWVPKPDRVNVGAVGAKVNTPEYQGFVTMWRKRVEGFQMRELKK